MSITTYFSFESPKNFYAKGNSEDEISFREIV